MLTPVAPLLLNRIRMRQALLMLAIHEHRTLHAAAQHLGMTASAASKMLHELEEAIGQTLLEREGRGLKLNPAGLAVMNARRSLRNTMTGLDRNCTNCSSAARRKSSSAAS